MTGPILIILGALLLTAVPDAGFWLRCARRRNSRKLVELAVQHNARVMDRRAARQISQEATKRAMREIRRKGAL